MSTGTWYYTGFYNTCVTCTSYIEPLTPPNNTYRFTSCYCCACHLSGDSGEAMIMSSSTCRASSPCSRHRCPEHGTGSSASPLLKTTIFVFSIAANCRDFFRDGNLEKGPPRGLINAITDACYVRVRYTGLNLCVCGFVYGALCPRSFDSSPKHLIHEIKQQKHSYCMNIPVVILGKSRKQKCKNSNYFSAICTMAGYFLS